MPQPRNDQETPWAPFKKEARTSQDIAGARMDVNLEDFGLLSWGDRNLRIGVNRADREHAITLPLLGWPNFARLAGRHIGAHVIRDIFILNRFATWVRTHRVSVSQDVILSPPPSLSWELCILIRGNFGS